MQKTSLNKEELNRLFTAAKKFNELKCWNWLCDTDLFAVQVPDSENIAYCSVLGRAGECFGMGIYLGDVQLGSFMRILERDYDIPQEIMHIQHCFTINFEDRKTISKEDYDLIKKSDINFRGKNQWPNFRSFEPGYYPWYLNDKELKFITIVLEQAYETVLILQEDEYKRSLFKEGKCFLSRLDSKGKISYDTILLRPDMDEPLISQCVDELSLLKTKKKCTKINTLWEIDTFYSPSCVDDEMIPYYPMVSAIVDAKMGQILGMHMSKKEVCFKEFKDYLTEFIEKHNIIPSKIATKNPNLYYAFKDFFSNLDVEFLLVGNLVIMPEIKLNMYNFL